MNTRFAKHYWVALAIIGAASAAEAGEPGSKDVATAAQVVTLDGLWSLLADSPKMKERFDHEVSDMIRRDRNHPCVIMWGLLNETGDGPVFRHAVEMLPLVRSLDGTRVVMLNSGRSDGRTGQIGGLSNPGSKVWEDVVSDQHPYQGVPHTAGIIRTLRTLSGGKTPVFVSEYGIGSSLDLVKMTRDYEQLGAEHVEDARWYEQDICPDTLYLDSRRWIGFPLPGTWRTMGL